MDQLFLACLLPAGVLSVGVMDAFCCSQKNVGLH